MTHAGYVAAGWGAAASCVGGYAVVAGRAGAASCRARCRPEDRRWS